IRLDLTDDTPGFWPIRLPAEIHGGDGDDQIFAGRGAATIFAEAGNDYVWGDRVGAGFYTDGGLGFDTIFGAGYCVNQIYGDLGGGCIIGGGEGSRNSLAGGDGNDTNTGKGDYPNPDGGRGWDYLYGGPGWTDGYDDPSGNIVDLGYQGGTGAFHAYHN